MIRTSTSLGNEISQEERKLKGATDHLLGATSSIEAIISIIFGSLLSKNSN